MVKGAKCDEHDDAHFMPDGSDYFEIIILRHGAGAPQNVMDATICTEAFGMMMDSLQRLGFKTFSPKGVRMAPGPLGPAPGVPRARPEVERPEPQPEPQPETPPGSPPNGSGSDTPGDDPLAEKDVGKEEANDVAAELAAETAEIEAAEAALRAEKLRTKIPEEAGTDDAEEGAEEEFAKDSECGDDEEGTGGS